MSKLVNLLTECINNVDPLSVSEYEKSGGFAALKKSRRKQS
jgi:hypothetical protein